MVAGKAPPWFKRGGSFSSFLSVLATTLSGSDLVDEGEDESDLIQHAVENAEGDLDLNKLDTCTFGSHMCVPCCTGSVSGLGR